MSWVSPQEPPRKRKCCGDCFRTGTLGTNICGTTGDSISVLKSFSSPAMTITMMMTMTMMVRMKIMIVMLTPTAFLTLNYPWACFATPVHAIIASIAIAIASVATASIVAISSIVTVVAIAVTKSAIAIIASISLLSRQSCSILFVLIDFMKPWPGYLGIQRSYTRCKIH